MGMFRQPYSPMVMFLGTYPTGKVLISGKKEWLSVEPRGLARCTSPIHLHVESDRQRTASNPHRTTRPLPPQSGRGVARRPYGTHRVMTLQVRRPHPDQEARPAGGPTTNSQFSEWRVDAQRALQALGSCGIPSHVEDFLALVGFPPRPQMIGAAFAAAAQQRLIEVVGAALAEGRLVRVWRGVPT